jgi:hypothetical protein
MEILSNASLSNPSSAIRGLDPGVFGRFDLAAMVQIPHA